MVWVGSASRGLRSLADARRVRSASRLSRRPVAVPALATADRRARGLPRPAALRATARRARGRSRPAAFAVATVTGRWARHQSQSAALARLSVTGASASQRARSAALAARTAIARWARYRPPPIYPPPSWRALPPPWTRTVLARNGQTHRLRPTLPAEPFAVLQAGSTPACRAAASRRAHPPPSARSCRRALRRGAARQLARHQHCRRHRLQEPRRLHA